MESGTKKIVFGILAGLTVATVSYVSWNNSSYSRPRLVQKSGKKFTIKYKGKDMVIDVEKLHNNGVPMAQMMAGGKWSLSPYYSNESDKKNSLSGLRLEKGNTGYNIWYF